jgi:hypothetical protein
MATAPRASTTTGGLARWPTPAPAPACLTPATPGVMGSGRLTAALRQSHRLRLRQPLPHRADRYVRQLMAHLTCATRNSQSAICAYCNQAVPTCWLQSVTVTYPELHLVRAGAGHRHHAPRCARWYPPAARSRLSAPTGANRSSSLAPRQRSGRSTSRDTERRECARSSWPLSSLSVMPGQGATHRAAAPSCTPATRDRAGRLHRDVPGRPAVCRNPGLLDDPALASVSRPASPGVRRHPADSRPSRSPLLEPRRHPGVPAGASARSYAVTLDQPHRQGRRSPCGRRGTALQEDLVGANPCVFGAGWSCMVMQAR